MPAYTAHCDTFARDNLPPSAQMPDCLFTLPQLQFPQRLNCADIILGRGRQAAGDSGTALRSAYGDWTYGELETSANQIARVLVEDMGIEPGNRVLLRAANNPALVACWFAVLKAGAIAVATMPLLRRHDLTPVITKARIRHALCDIRLQEELTAAAADSPLEHCLLFDGSGRAGADAELNRLMQQKPGIFPTVDTASDDIALIAFTSGTTGQPKGTIHFHRDVISMCVCVGENLVDVQSNDVVTGSPPLAFTFGLGMLLAFPLYAGASSVLLENAAPAELAAGIERYRASVCATAPTAYRALLAGIDDANLKSLKKCVSAGEHLPLATYDDWLAATGIAMINGLGTTEMIHIFVSAAGDQIRPGATGMALPGYEARIVGDDNQLLPFGESGRLAVRGPTGCKYLADIRQKDYVIGGWNITGDACELDADGYIWYQGRLDDMIISAGYNIAGPEVEQALLPHPAVSECAVIGAPDEERGMLVKAFVVLNEEYTPGAEMIRTLQEYVKATIAPYKYPRVIEFINELPKTYTGKIQRSKLRQQEINRSRSS